MTAQERLELIEQLWDSLPDEAVPLTEAQGQELESRLKAFDHEKSKTVTWDEIKADWDARKR